MKGIQTVVFILASLFLASTAAYYDGLVHKSVDRSINLESQFARHTLNIELANTGSKQATEYYYLVQEKYVQNLAFFEVTDEKGAKLKHTVEAPVEQGNERYTPIQVAVTLAPSATTKIQVRLVFSHALAPFPVEIAQDQKQLVKYYDNHYFYTYYTTNTQTTTVKLASSSIEKKSELSPTSVSGNTITYGPYDNVKPQSKSELFVHFENNKPFLTATSVTKEIEISHWGNVAIEESYEIQHDGAKLKGTFSRFLFQRSYRQSTNVVTSFKQILPAGASDVYYRDEIGNISTSHLNPTASEGITMDVIPRFPLFGGWKIGFYFGYNLPTQGYLFTDVNDGSVYVLNTTFASQFPDIAIQELTVKVILPEGVKDIDFFAPFAVDSSSYETRFTYLDTSGRTVLVLKKHNVVPEHNQNFQVTYRFSQISLLQEPILLIGAFFFFYLFVLVAQRIPLQFGDAKSKLSGPNSERVEALLLRLKEIGESRSENYAALEDAVDKYVKGGSEKQYNLEKKAIDAAFTKLTKEFSAVHNEIHEVAVEFSKRVKELARKVERKAIAKQELIDLEISHKVAKAIGKTAFDKKKEELEKAYYINEEELETAISDITDSL